MHAPRTSAGRRRGPARRGLAAVEFAILLPLLCFLFAAAVDFSRIFYYDLIVANCARSGALYGSQDTTCAVDTSGIQAVAQKDAADLNSQQLTVTSSVNSSSNPTRVTVTVTYPFSTISRYPGIPSQITLSRTVQANVVPWTPN